MRLVEDDPLPDDRQELNGPQIVDLFTLGRPHLVQLDCLRLGKHRFHFGHDGAVGGDDEVVLGKAR